MQTLRLHDDFIVECCVHTHAYAHTHAHTYIYIWLTATKALQTAVDNTDTHTLSQTFTHQLPLDISKSRHMARNN